MDKKLKSIRFPGLPDRYTIPQTAEDIPMSEDDPRSIKQGIDEAGAYNVTFTFDYEQDKFICDKTYEEILEIYNSGKTVIGIVVDNPNRAHYFPLVSVNEDSGWLGFVGITTGGASIYGNSILIYSDNGKISLRDYQHTVACTIVKDDDGEWFVFDQYLEEKLLDETPLVLYALDEEGGTNCTSGYFLESFDYYDNRKAVFGKLIQEENKIVHHTFTIKKILNDYQISENKETVFEPKALSFTDAQENGNIVITEVVPNGE